jgi:hypothetical protein
VQGCARLALAKYLQAAGYAFSIERVRRHRQVSLLTPIARRPGGGATQISGVTQKRFRRGLCRSEPGQASTRNRPGIEPDPPL